MNLLTFANAKTIKGEELGWRTAILYLAPHKISGTNLCENASPGCIASCLFTAGRGVQKNVREARINKTRYFLDKKEEFLEQLRSEIEREERSAAKAGFSLCVRLNGTSDIRWEELNIIQQFPHIQFYDYTKIPERVLSNKLKNYDLTFSLNELNSNHAKKVLDKGFNVAAVLPTSELPETHLGAPVINGDEHDLRFLDLKGHIVGLKAKGKARYDKIGFVLKTNQPQPAGAMVK